MTTHAQQIGDTVQYRMFDKPFIYLYENYYEIVEQTDTIITIYNICFKDDIIFGIDYIYSEEKCLKHALKLILNDAFGIGYNMFLTRDNKIVIVQNNDLIMIRDANTLRSERIFSFDEKEQGETK